MIGLPHIGKHPPPNPICGDMWYNIITQNYYYYNEIGKWIAIDGDLVVDVIEHYETDEDAEAYHRAMSVL